MSEPKWLDGYSGQTIDELIACAGEYRVDSIVLAFEQAVQATAERDGVTGLSEAERTILAVEALEREVNNGGYHQFFMNSPGHAPSIVAALERIGCPAAARISAEAIDRLGLRHPFTAEQVDAALAGDADGRLPGALRERCDWAFYDSGEPIADRLFAYIQAHRDSIRLPGRTS